MELVDVLLQFSRDEEDDLLVYAIEKSVHENEVLYDTWQLEVTEPEPKYFRLMATVAYGSMHKLSDVYHEVSDRSRRQISLKTESRLLARYAKIVENCQRRDRMDELMRLLEEASSHARFLLESKYAIDNTSGELQQTGKTFIDHIEAKRDILGAQIVLADMKILAEFKKIKPEPPEVKWQSPKSRSKNFD